jgi:hypothetical protein
MSAAPLSPAELVFIKRMAPHVAAGLTIEKAAAAVIADDERLFIALHDRDTGPAIRAEITGQVYAGIRGEGAAL